MEKFGENLVSDSLSQLGLKTKKIRFDNNSRLQRIKSNNKPGSSRKNTFTDVI